MKIARDKVLSHKSTLFTALEMFLFIPTVLDTNNAAYLVLKHGFPPASWLELATGKEDTSSSFQLTSIAP